MFNQAETWDACRARWSAKIPYAIFRPTILRSVLGPDKLKKVALLNVNYSAEKNLTGLNFGRLLRLTCHSIRAKFQQDRM